MSDSILLTVAEQAPIVITIAQDGGGFSGDVVDLPVITVMKAASAMTRGNLVYINPTGLDGYVTKTPVGCMMPVGSVYSLSANADEDVEITTGGKGYLKPQSSQTASRGALAVVSTTEEGVCTVRRGAPGAITPTSITVSAGTLDSGDVTSVATRDGDYAVITETTGGLSFECTFRDIDKVTRGFLLVAHYEGSTGHTVKVKAWHTTNGWTPVTTKTKDILSVTTNSPNSQYNFNIPAAEIANYYDADGDIMWGVFHESPFTAGHVMHVELANAIPMDDNIHFREVGHFIESGTADGVPALAILHFN